MIPTHLLQYPEVEATVRESLGVAYRRRSMFDDAAPHLQRSLEIRRRALGEDHPDTARSYIAIADLRFEHEGSIDDSLALLRRAFDIYARNGLAGTSAEGWLQLDIGLISLAGDRIAEAGHAFERCRELLARERGAEHSDVSRPVLGLAMVALHRGDREGAERLARLAVGLCEREDKKYIGGQANLALAQVLLAAESYREAAAALEEAGEQLSQTVEDPHIRIAEHDALVSELHRRRGDFASAERVAARCEEMRRRILHPDHWAILEGRLARQRARLGLGEAESVGPELLDIESAAASRLGRDHPLMIQLAEARLDHAMAVPDATLERACRDRLADLRESRSLRLGLQVAPQAH
jgi:tetratricopeptide (TPR) repeat protein